MHRQSIPLIFILIALAGAAGCTSTGAVADPSADPRETPSVVSLAPSETEIVYAVGGTLIGRTDYCDYPPRAAAVPTVGGPKTLSVETIARLDPDLILATTVTDTMVVEQLGTLGYDVRVYDLQTLEDIYQNTWDVGTLLHRSDDAETLVADLERRQEAVFSSVSTDERVPTLFVVWGDPLYVAGNRTLHHQLITLAGGRNIFADQEGYFIASEEAVVERAPEVIITATSHTGGTASIVDALRARTAISSIPAIENDRIYTIPADLLNRPGPRVIDGLEQIAVCLAG
ncbi:MAG: ABC transporter substrate-binding protein [Methanomicrobiales archaeon]